MDHINMRILYGCLNKLRVHFFCVLVIRALLFRAYTRATEFGNSQVLVRPKTRGIPETMIGRVLIFMWSFRPLLKKFRALLQLRAHQANTELAISACNYWVALMEPSLKFLIIWFLDHGSLISLPEQQSRLRLIRFLGLLKSKALQMVLRGCHDITSRNMHLLTAQESHQLIGLQVCEK